MQITIDSSSSVILKELTQNFKISVYSYCSLLRVYITVRVRVRQNLAFLFISWSIKSNEVNKKNMHNIKNFINDNYRAVFFYIYLFALNNKTVIHLEWMVDSTPRC